MNERKMTLNSRISISEAEEAPDVAGLCIPKAGNPHTVGETLCLPLAKKLIHILEIL